MRFLNKFYLDKEKDIIVKLFKSQEDEVTYIIETPNHHTGNLITNLAKLCEVGITRNENNMKIMKGILPARINGDNEEVYILRLGGIKIANIYNDGRIEIKAKIPAITKTLMSQTKEYRLPIEKTIVKSYIYKKTKFRTDLHTHMNAVLSPDTLIALGIKHQIKYPLYYIKKLDLKMSKEQEERIYQKREEVEKQFIDCPLTGKYLTRKIDDNTFINFADFILNNPEHAEYNIAKIRPSLAILKDGQAVFTNLEKVYIYRYVFCRGIPSEEVERMELNEEKIETIPEEDIKQTVRKMLKDTENEVFKNNNVREDKFLWIAREYQGQGIQYVELADTNLVKAHGEAIRLIEELHKVMPAIEQETGVKIRFLAAIRRVPLTIIRGQKTNSNYLRENLDVLKVVAKSPYVVGSDFIGEEINDISELKPVITEIVDYIGKVDEDFTIRFHAGENDSLRDNVAKSIECVKNSLKPGQKMPMIRIGHGLYTADLNSEEGKKLIQELRDTKAILEFQITSNVRLNNLNNLSKHPLKQYLEEQIRCVQGTDGCGFYGIDTIDEQLALQNLVNLSEEDFAKMREVEEEVIKHHNTYFERKSKEFEQLLKGRTIQEVLSKMEEENHRNSQDNNISMRINDNIDAEEAVKGKIAEFPLEKTPIIIAGGSFNKQGRETAVTKEGRAILELFLKKINPKKVFFLVGHKLQGYEKAILEISKELKKEFEVNAIIPKMISKEEKKKLLEENIKVIRISTEEAEMGIYKSFNYEIFERRKSIVIAFDGNSPVSNLVQEAKNGKGKAYIYVDSNVDSLKEKAKSLGGYVHTFHDNIEIVEKILEENEEII